ncbi:hypothetical protein CB1_001533084 [Camelus ferus]|nr:hypothetical protein CB1_001533084 [Camelus ferus]
MALLWPCPHASCSGTHVCTPPLPQLWASPWDCWCAVQQEQKHLLVGSWQTVLLLWPECVKEDVESPLQGGSGYSGDLFAGPDEAQRSWYLFPGAQLMSSNMSNALANAVCQRCQARFAPAERIVNSSGELFHEHCFVCAQCFRPFPEGLFYEFEGRKYCEHDFQMLFAPCCGSCGEFIVGRVIKAMNSNWHPGCFRCELCDVELADLGFVKNAGR